MRAAVRRLVGVGARIGVGAAVAHYVPSMAVLGQWSKLRGSAGLCRWRGPDGNAVAFTFDDGPHPEATPAVLERLGELGWPATFFCLGSLAERHGEVITEMVRRGHQVEVHGHRHGHHLLHSPRWIVRDLDAAVRAMETLGIASTLYRPTFGQLTGTTLAAARRLRLQTVLWSSWGREWTTKDPREVADRVLGTLHGGSIVLLHDNDAFGPEGMWRVALESLDLIAPVLEQRGMVPVTLANLLNAPPVTTPSS